MTGQGAGQGSGYRGAMPHSMNDLTRRRVLAAGAATAAWAAVGSTALGPRALEASEPAPVPTPPSVKMPVGYVSHGSPMSALHKGRCAEWNAWATSQPAPKAILVISAHYTLMPTTIGATETVPLLYDFRGFPEALSQLTWAAPGAPALAKRVEQVLKPVGKVDHDPERGHDHGAWVPLRAMYPKADIPTLSISLPTRNPQTLFKMGQALAPLRDEGVFILGSGSMTHNLGYEHPRGAKAPTWAKEFDAWATETLEKNEVDALLDWQEKAPAARTNHPTVEHFIPLILAAGARRSDDVVRFPLAGFDNAIMSNRCVSFAPPAKKG
jgi:4,5-DOPA dioxygenase extradiol